MSRQGSILRYNLPKFGAYLSQRRTKAVEIWRVIMIETRMAQLVTFLGLQEIIVFNWSPSFTMSRFCLASGLELSLRLETLWIRYPSGNSHISFKGSWEDDFPFPQKGYVSSTVFFWSFKVWVPRNADKLPSTKTSSPVGFSSYIRPSRKRRWLALHWQCTVGSSTTDAYNTWLQMVYKQPGVEIGPGCLPIINTLDINTLVVYLLWILVIKQPVERA